MKTLLTGADGYIGRRLISHAVEAFSPGELTLVDVKFRERLQHPCLQYVEGSLTDSGIMERITADKVDMVFHFDAIPGGWAEEDLLQADKLDLYRTWLLPPLRATTEEVMDALTKVYNLNAQELVRYMPVASVEERSGLLPPIHCPEAEAFGSTATAR